MQNLQIIYHIWTICCHIPSHTPQPPTPPDNHLFLPLKGKPLIFFWHLSLCPTVCTSQFVIDTSLYNSWEYFTNLEQVYESLWELIRKWVGSHGPNGCHAHKTIKHLLLQHPVLLLGMYSIATLVLPRLFKWWSWVDLDLFTTSSTMEKW